MRFKKSWFLFLLFSFPLFDSFHSRHYLRHSIIKHSQIQMMLLDPFFMKIPFFKPKPIILPTNQNDSNNNINNNIKNNNNSNENKESEKLEKYKEFQMNWYVIDESKKIRTNQLYQVSIWGKKYVYWKDSNDKYNAIQDACNHRGAFLSKGKIIKETNCIQCPYHGLEFDANGNLKKIPGQEIPQAQSFHQDAFYILEKEGWLWMNLIPKQQFTHSKTSEPSEPFEPSEETLLQMLYHEPEAQMQGFSKIQTNIPSLSVSSQLLSENLLDILHITFVHTFGNKEYPIPLNEPMPYQIRTFLFNSETDTKSQLNLKSNIQNPTIISKTLNSYPFSLPKTDLTILPPRPHYGIQYLFKPQQDSFITNYFGEQNIMIENEFLLPHLTVSRVIFGPYQKTVVGFSLPLNKTHTRLFVKLYRNYWNAPNKNANISFNQKTDTYKSFFPFTWFENIIQNICDQMMLYVLLETLEEDRSVVEHLDSMPKGGKYNLKYDKFPSMFRSMYQKYVLKKNNMTIVDE